IAQALDIPIGTVKSRISRGRAALAARLRLEHSPVALFPSETASGSGPESGPADTTDIVDVDEGVRIVAHDAPDPDPLPDAPSDSGPDRGNQTGPPERPTDLT